MIPDSLRPRVDALVREYHECEDRMADPEVVGDQARYVEVSRRYRALEPLSRCVGEYDEAAGDLEAARELFSLADGAEKDELRAQVADLESTLDRLAEELKVLLLPRDPNDDRNVIVEIRGAEGGEEANLFARDLFEMYKGVASRRGWSFEVLSSTVSDMGGFAEVTFRVAGDAVWSRMKFEAGPHRVQRVPVTESQGRIHTSSATVVVLPEAEEVDVVIDPNDLQIDVYRSSGPGGQSVNTTDSAVRITHLPTGTVVSMQDEKSQLQNKQRALAVLRSRLLQVEQERAASEASGQRKSQIGGGGRSEKIRTYNFKENRVTDHRIGLTVHQLDRILAGDLDEFSDALVADERARRLAEAEG